jgi:glycerol-3-phosphate dehydrogenase (NAD(P)+)
MKITVIGDGGWGTAAALLLNSYGHKVTVWGPFPDYLEEVRTRRENPRFLPGVPLPADLAWSGDPAAAVEGAEAVILAVPSKFLGDVCRRFIGLVPDNALTVSLTKGLCENTHCRMSELAQNILGLEQIAVLSGPSHAEEVARGIPTAVVAAAADEAVALQTQSLFSGPRFRVYTSTDPLGVEIGGAVKNVIAIAVGASDGLGFGDNTRAALITRGLAEIIRFGVALGATPATFAGLSGAGDLIVTCTSRHSRNYTVGARLGRGELIGDILDSMRMVAEGVWNAKVIHTLGRQHDVEMPITDTVYALCHHNLSPRDAVESLMARSTKPEC